MPVEIGISLSLEDVVAVARGADVALAPSALPRIRAARDRVQRAADSAETVYGVTTGFGSLANVAIASADAVGLQHSIVRSHATAVGPLLSREEARAMLVLRAHGLARGHSGVREELIERMLEFLARDLTPAVPQQGSLGASGDLAPLACLALPLIGGGAFLSPDGASTVPAADALRSAGLEPLGLVAKEGLSLVNGTEGMLAVGIPALMRLSTLVRTADVIAAMTIEGALGSDRPFDERLHALRPHPGQVASASNLRKLLAGSPIVASHHDSPHLLQDAYSLRCAPQVHGATRDALAYARRVLEIEVDAVADNPVVFAEGGDIVSGGNFHGQPVATALDALAIATVPMASISERRLYRLLDPATGNGLPPFLVRDAGLNSGFMLVQYTAASLVSECKILSHPASVDSIPSSAGQEDHVSMGMTSARTFRDVVGNAEMVLALEALAAAQALDLRAPVAAGAATGAARDLIRSRVAFLEADRELGPDIASTVEMVRSGALVTAAASAVGELA